MTQPPMTGVIGHDEDGDDGVDPAAEREPALFAKGRESAHRALLGHPAQSRLRHDHGIAKRERQQNVDEQKNAAAILGRQIRKRQMPRPTDAPAADSTKPILPENALRFLY